MKPQCPNGRPETALWLLKFSWVAAALLWMGCATSRQLAQAPVPETEPVRESVGYTPGQGRIEAVRGSVYVWRGKWVRAREGQTVEPGVSVWTTDDGVIDLNFGLNGRWVRLMERSILRVEQLEQSKNGGRKLHRTRLHLREGRVLGFVNHRADDFQYEIQTPFCLADFKVAALYEMRATGAIVVKTGQARIKDSSGEILLSKGESRGDTTSPWPPEMACRKHGVIMSWRRIERPLPPASCLDLKTNEYEWVCDACERRANRWQNRPSDLSYGPALEFDASPPKRKF